MFDSLMREARSTVDNALSSVLYRAGVALLLLVAVGFATASLSIWINRQLGPESGNLVVAAIYLVAGLILYVVAGTSDSSALLTPVAAETAPQTGERRDAGQHSLSSEIDRELLYSAAASALPFALPRLTRLMMRNIPLLAAIAAAIYIMTRPTNDATSRQAGDLADNLTRDLDGAPAE